MMIVVLIRGRVLTACRDGATGDCVRPIHTIVLRRALFLAKDVNERLPSLP